MENNIASILVETLLKTAGTDFTKLYIIIHTIETIERTIYQTIVQTIMSSNYGPDYSSNYSLGCSSKQGRYNKGSSIEFLLK